MSEEKIEAFKQQMQVPMARWPTGYGLELRALAEEMHKVQDFSTSAVIYEEDVLRSEEEVAQKNVEVAQAETLNPQTPAALCTTPKAYTPNRAGRR